MKKVEKKQGKVKNKKENVKSLNNIKIITVCLLVVLVSMVGFLGVYTTDSNNVSNKLKDYSLAMNLKGTRNIRLKVDTESKDVIKDSEGKVIESATDEEIAEKGYQKETVPNNSADVLTIENYKKTKNIIEKRLKTLGVEQYDLSLNEQTGEIFISIPEDDNTDSVVSNLTTIGKFEIIDADTAEVLLNNSYIKSSNVLYSNTSSGTAAYLEIAFNKEGTKKLEDITKTYVKVEKEESEDKTEESTEETTDETSQENVEEKEQANTEENTEETSEENAEENKEKQISMKIDDEAILTSSFDEPITDGKIQLSVGTATTDSKTLQENVEQARNVATVLDNGNLPIKYNVDNNKYVLSNISNKSIVCFEVAVFVLMIVAVVFLVAKYKVNGLLAGISFVGLSAIYLLVIRYTNVVISFESIFGILAMIILDYLFTVCLLNNIDVFTAQKVEKVVSKSIKETYKNFFIRIIPICILTIVFCFIKWIPISSFGMITFWGISIIAIYNAIITKFLLNTRVESK